MVAQKEGPASSGGGSGPSSSISAAGTANVGINDNGKRPADAPAGPSSQHRKANVQGQRRDFPHKRLAENYIEYGEWVSSNN